MFCSKNLNTLSVLSLYEGDLLGNVDKLYFDKKLKKLVEIELIGQDGIKLFLPSKNIYKIGKNAITVRNNQAVNIKSEHSNLVLIPIDSKAYSIQGEFLGSISEIYFNNKFITEKIELNSEKSYKQNFVASCGKNTVVFKEENQKVNINKFMPETIKTNEIITQKEESTPAEETKKDSVQIIKNTNSTDFLLGRICTKDIYNFNNELLIKAQTSINKKHIKDIKKYGKLRELMIFSK